MNLPKTKYGMRQPYYCLFAAIYGAQLLLFERLLSLKKSHVQIAEHFLDSGSLNEWEAFEDSLSCQALCDTCIFEVDQELNLVHKTKK